MQELFQNELAVNALLSLAIILLAFVLVRIGHRLSRKYMDDPARIYRSTRSTRRLAVFLAIVAITILWSPNFGNVLTLLTVIGAGMAIALREVLLSFAGWSRITLLSSYNEGDRSEINGIKGDVIDIRMMRTSLMEIGGWGYALVRLLGGWSSPTPQRSAPALSTIHLAIHGTMYWPMYVTALGEFGG